MQGPSPIHTTRPRKGTTGCCAGTREPPVPTMVVGNTAMSAFVLRPLILADALLSPSKCWRPLILQRPDEISSLRPRWSARISAGSAYPNTRRRRGSFVFGQVLVARQTTPDETVYCVWWHDRRHRSSLRRMQSDTLFHLNYFAALQLSW